MRQTELHFTNEDRELIESYRAKGQHQAREVNRTHILSALDRGIQVAMELTDTDVAALPSRPWQYARCAPARCLPTDDAPSAQSSIRLIWYFGSVVSG